MTYHTVKKLQLSVGYSVKDLKPNALAHEKTEAFKIAFIDEMNSMLGAGKIAEWADQLPLNGLPIEPTTGGADVADVIDYVAVKLADANVNLEVADLVQQICETTPDGWRRLRRLRVKLEGEVLNTRRVVERYKDPWTEAADVKQELDEMEIYVTLTWVANKS